MLSFVRAKFSLVDFFSRLILLNIKCVSAIGIFYKIKCRLLFAEKYFHNEN